MEKRKITPGALKSALAVVVCMSLYGCGGGSDGGGAESSAPSAPSIAPVTQTDFWLTAVQPALSEQGGYQAVIDLSQYFQNASTDVRALTSEINSVQITDNGGGVCMSAFTVSGQNQSFTVDIPNANSFGTCQFEVTVSDGAVKRVIADLTSTPAEKIPAISQALNKGASVTIDLATATETASFITAGYALSTTSTPEVFGDVAVTASGNTLAVTASQVLGANRIVYQLVKDGDSKTGVIDMTVSNPDITALQILKNNLTQTVATKVKLPIYLIGDGIVQYGTYKSLQIIDLKTPEGGVATIIDKTSALAFEFSSDTVGEFTVNYTVSDHYGGYASGSVIINAGLLTSPNTEQARNPGRMTERVVLDEGGLRLIINRPQLLVEMQDIYALCTGQNFCRPSMMGTERYELTLM